MDLEDADRIGDAEASREAGGKAARRGRRRLARRALAAALALAGVAVLYAALAGVSARLPDWVSDRVEAAVNERAGGARLRIGSLELAVEPGLRPRARAHSVAVFAASGAEVAVIDRASARLFPGRALRGAAGSWALEVSGATATVRRGADGEFELAFGAATGAAGSPAAVLDQLEDVLSTGVFAALEGVTAEDVTISLEDAHSGRLWQATGGAAALRNGPDGLYLRVEADVFNGTEELVGAVIGFRTDRESPRATLNASFENAVAADIAAQSPALGFLDVLDAPVSGSLRTTLGEDGQVESLAGTLNVGSGALRPDPGAPPIEFRGGQAYVEYDPGTRTVRFPQLSVEGGAVRLAGSGSAQLQDFRDGWPESLVAQFFLSELWLRPAGVLAAPAVFDSGAVEFRLRLDPFDIDVRQISLGPADRRLLGSARVAVAEAGWSVALDVASDHAMDPAEVLGLWPLPVAPGARDWVSRNVAAGEVFDLAAAMRFSPGAEPRVSVGFLFDEAEIRPLDFLPPIHGGSGYASFDGTAFFATLERGRMAAPGGGEADLAGTHFRVPDVTAEVERGEVRILSNSSIPAALSLLNLLPTAPLDAAGIPAALASGRAKVRAELDFDLLMDLDIEDVGFAVEGELLDVFSPRLVEGREFRASRLDLAASPEAVEVSGRAELAGVPATGSWRQDIGPGADGASRIVAELELGEALFGLFGAGLPPGAARGAAAGRLRIDLAPGAAPAFSLASDLDGVGFSLPALGWSKPPDGAGSLEVEGLFGAVPSVERLALEAPGLSVNGRIDLDPGGGLERAEFERVRIGDWFDARVSLVDLGDGGLPAVVIAGGTVDLGARPDLDAGGAAGASRRGPLTAHLDRLAVSGGIALTDFRGEFPAGAALEGRFTADVNDAAPIHGEIAQAPEGPVIRVTSEMAGEALAAAGILRSTRDGTLDLRLASTAEGGFDGRAAIRNLRILEAPALAELISALSIVGLLEQLNGEGISMSSVEAEFHLDGDRVTLLSSSATGPSLGISLRGVYDAEADRLDMDGVLSPIYFLNAIGQVFSPGRDGLFGFTFRLFGDADAPTVRVNPLSILTPGAFREIFRRPPPEPPSR